MIYEPGFYWVRWDRVDGEWTVGELTNYGWNVVGCNISDLRVGKDIIEVGAAIHRISHSLPGDVGTDHRVDMANVGEALMEAIRDYSGHAFMKHWHPADCPSEIVGDLLNALDETDGWRLVAGLPMWWAGIVTDGEHVAFAQKAEADFDGYYWAVDPEDALEWEPTHCIAAPGNAIAALTPSPCPGDVGKASADPNAAHVNMLRGGIARPSLAQIIHIYGEDAIRAALPSHQGAGEP